MKFIIILSLVSSLISSIAMASSPAPSFAYPELQVSPRATERITIELSSEARDRRTQLLPLQISALSTLLAGLLAPKPSDPIKADSDDTKYSRIVAIGVGASWLAFSYFFNEGYSPYSNAQSALKNFPDKTPQEQLVRERIAQEHIEAAGSIGKKIMWASAATNLLASAYVASATSKEGIVYAAVGGVLAFAPLVFKDKWQTVNEYHQEYKKRIYGPIAMPTLMLAPRLADNRSSTIVPGVIWHLSF